MPTPKKSRFLYYPPSFKSYVPNNCLKEVTNTVSLKKSLLPDCTDQKPPSILKKEESVEEMQLKLLSIMDGFFEAPGFTNSKKFRHAVHRQRLVSHSRSLTAKIVYEPEWDGISKAVYTRTVADWDWLSGEVFHVRWWSRGMHQFCKWDREMKFWTYEELQEVHREHLDGTSGPEDHDWCRLDGTMHWDMFWSAALLFRFAGSSGVKSWDDQFQAMKNSPSQ